MSESIHTERAPAAVGPYSQAVRAGGFLFVSGQIPVNPENGQIPAGVEAQAEQAFRNLREILAAAGAELKDVVKTTVFLQDMNTFAAVNRIYAEFFPSPFPARSCVEVSALPKGVLLEVEAIAALPA